MIKDHIHKRVQAVLQNLNLPSDKLTITPPNNEEFGDYSTSIALQLAKQEKKNPMEIAQEIANNIETGSFIGNVKVMKPGFVNLSLSKGYLLENLSQSDASYGHSDVDKGKEVIVEYSSPNIAKPFSIGHLRSTIIGDAVAHILEATGHTVYRDNHVGDWGTQFGKQIYAIKTWGDETAIEQSDHPVKMLVELYVKFHNEAEKSPKLEEEGRRWFKKLEEGDEEARRLWKNCIAWSWQEFDKIYAKLGVSFTENNGHGYGESFFEDKMEPVIEELKAKEILKESNGALLVFFPDEKYPPMMVVKQDGATLYSTRDLATDKFRLEKYGKDIKIINEVGAEQSLYFKQLYETEKLAGWVQEGQRIHIKHGMYRFKDRKMSTRKGNTIWLEDVLEEATERAKKLGKEDSIPKGVSQKIGIGALKWNDLKRNSHMDIVFDWDDILNMQGNSGPYIQYTHVRCQSILSKSHPEEGTTEGSTQENYEEMLPTPKTAGLLDNELNEDELTLLRALVKYPEVVQDAAANFAPNYICTYLYDLAQKYNLFYQKHQILKADNEDKRKLRLAITQAVANVLENGLSLLGIETVEKM